MNALLLARSDTDVQALLPRALVLWLVGGTIVCAILPVSAWNSVLVGWLPFWLVVSPALCLCLLHRQRMAAALSAFLVRRSRRRPSATRRRRSATSRSSARSTSRTAEVRAPRANA